MSNFMVPGVVSFVFLLVGTGVIIWGFVELIGGISGAVSQGGGGISSNPNPATSKKNEQEVKKEAEESKKEASQEEKLDEAEGKIDKNIERGINGINRDLNYLDKVEAERIKQLRILVRALEDVEKNPQILSTDKWKKNLAPRISKIIDNVLTVKKEGRFIGDLLSKVDKVQLEEKNVLNYLKNKILLLSRMEGYVNNIENKINLKQPKNAEDELERKRIIQNAKVVSTELATIKRELAKIEAETSSALLEYERQANDVNSKRVFEDIYNKMSEVKKMADDKLKSKDAQLGVEDITLLKKNFQGLMEYLSTYIRKIGTYNEEVNKLLATAKETLSENSEFSKKFNLIKSAFSEIAKNVGMYLQKTRSS